MKESVTIRHTDSEKPSMRRKGRTSRTNQKKAMISIPRDDYLVLVKFLRGVMEIFGHKNAPEEIERERIKRETMERGNYQPGLGWTYMNHVVPIVSEDWNRKYERRKEIIRKGTWNSSKKGWEYDGDFAGIWD